jgi:capsular polysaccharide biosynthesis protein
MKLKKILKPIGKFFKKHWKKWTILAILGIIIYISFIFYQYIYKPIYQSQELIPQKLRIKKQIYQEVMDFYFQRQENITKIISRDYLDPFK